MICGALGWFLVTGMVEFLSAGAGDHNDGNDRQKEVMNLRLWMVEGSRA